MKSITSKALVALLATGLSLAGIWTVSAQNTPAPDTASPSVPGGPANAAPGPDMRSMHRHMGHPGWRMGGPGMQHWGMGGQGMQHWRMNSGPHGMWGMHERGMADWGRGLRGRLMNVVCSPRGAEAIDIAFVRLSYRLDLTSEQQPLFDALKATALDEQKSFAEACQSARPAPGHRPDAVERMKSRITLETARLAALNAILPKFEALYSSLTDQQKAALTPRRGPRANARSGREAPFTAPTRPAPNTAPGTPAPKTPSPSNMPSTT
jgi:hypothetical protein